MSQRSQRYPQELRERAIRLVAEVRDQYESEWAAIESVAAKLGIGSTETLRKWIRRSEVDAGQRPGVSSEESAEVRRLRAEVRELRRANEILKAAAGFMRTPRLCRIGAVSVGVGAVRRRWRPLCQSA
jgi:transposase